MWRIDKILFQNNAETLCRPTKQIVEEIPVCSFILGKAIIQSKRGKAVLLHAQQAHGGGRGIALPMLDPGARREWVVGAMPPLLYAWGRDLVPIVQEAGLASGPVWMSLENLAPTRVRTWTVQTIASCYTNYAIPANS